MPVPVRLSAPTPDALSVAGDTLGARLRRRRRELGLRRIDAAARMGVDWKTLMWWERDEREPYVSAYPAIIAFLDYEPWVEPATLAGALLAERRRRGLRIDQIAALIGVDEGTWRRWERGEWKPTRRTGPMLSSLLELPLASTFPNEVR